MKSDSKKKNSAKKCIPRKVCQIGIFVGILKSYTILTYLFLPKPWLIDFTCSKQFKKNLKVRNHY